MKRATLACLVLVLLALAVFPVPVAAADEKGCTGSGCTAGGGNQCRIMRVDSKTIREWQRQIDAQPVATAKKPQLSRMAATVSQATGSLSLLDHVDYDPVERDQGRCGNGWAWAGTGIMEIAHDVNYGIRDRLSLQFLNSNLNGGGPSNYGCCGSGLGIFANFYGASEPYAIPWSNTNGDFQDGGTCCGDSPACVAPYDRTSVPAGTIGTEPRYGISFITAETVLTHGDDVSDEQAIQNIRSILDSSRGVYYSWCLADSADWAGFQSFWDGQAEVDLWDPTPYAGHNFNDEEGGCHAVLVVGYDTPDAGDPYWLMLNSWGTTPQRPNGLFRMKQAIDYDMVYIDTDSVGYPLMNWETLDVRFNRPPVAEAGGPYAGSEGSQVTFDASGSSDPDPGTTLHYRWDVNSDGTWDIDWTTEARTDYTYCDDFTGTVTLEISDRYENVPLTDTAMAAVTIDEVPAVVDAGPDQVAEKGATVQFQGTVTDPATCETRAYAWDFGDGGTASGTLSPTHEYRRTGTFTVTLTVTDDGTPVQDTLVVTVEDVTSGIKVKAGHDQEAKEGETVQFRGKVTCKGTCGDLAYAWDFGDGETAAGTLTPAHEYGREGKYKVTLTVSGAGGLSGSDSLRVEVKNVKPEVSIDSLEQPDGQFILPGHDLEFTGSFTDPGWLDTHTASWDFGEGKPVPGSLTGENEKPDATGTTTASRAFPAPGTYRVTLTVRDDARGEGTDTMKVKVFTPCEALQDLKKFINSIPNSAFKGQAHERKNAMARTIESASGMVEKKKYREAMQELRNLREKADGSQGGNAGDDWIGDPAAQQQVCAQIDNLNAYLATLQKK